MGPAWVPALLVSPYARRGYVDHTQLDFTSILKFIEENERGRWPSAMPRPRASPAPSTSPPRAAWYVPANRRPNCSPAGRRRVIYTAYGLALCLSIAILVGTRFRPLELERSHPCQPGPGRRDPGSKAAMVAPSPNPVLHRRPGAGPGSAFRPGRVGRAGRASSGSVSLNRV